MISRCGWQGPRYWNHHLLPPRVHCTVGRRKWSWDWNQALQDGGGGAGVPRCVLPPCHSPRPLLSFSDSALSLRLNPIFLCSVQMSATPMMMTAVINPGPAMIPILRQASCRLFPLPTTLQDVISPPATGQQDSLQFSKSSIRYDFFSSKAGFSHLLKNRFIEICHIEKQNYLLSLANIQKLGTSM